ncbi:MAG TPA: cytochrome c [Candidatus Obscuribacter sp.]|nr:cytochrome c [Candidatus Obscuribacter sp.]MBK9276892.1 cytochrome c [Candidatus Obscuribacter sp.]MBL8081825.1 cytochrome c [Candidatus Obscuribacter sp.]HMW92892.1 cytochrome c [Candidatus Obscuribacter sp.]HMX47924.1 cytochrome c [Candidatus Obscuribacter sp.]
MSNRFRPDAACSVASQKGGAGRSPRPTAGLFFLALLAMFTGSSALSGCVMSEEMKRIDQVKKAQRERAMEGSTNLTGEQIFIRSCNTCHPSAKAGMGPSLEAMNAKFPEDQALKQFIRKGKGMMPGQSVERINNDELDNLITYLRALEFSK